VEHSFTIQWKNLTFLASKFDRNK